jgi:TRAP-type C4-dicarboxylate transport system permease small subunit
MRLLEWPLRAIDWVAAWLIGLMLVVITLVLFTNAVARYFAGITIIGGEELARCLMVWMTFLGSHLLVRTRSHVAIDLLAKVLTGRPRALLTSLIAVIGVLVCAYVAKLGWDLTERIFSTGQRMSSLPLARGWFYLPIPLGFGLMSVSFLQVLIATWTGARQPELSDFGPSTAEQAAVAAPAAAGLDKA